MVVVCSSYCEESVDIKFLIVVAIAMKLLKIKDNYVSDPETLLEQNL